MIHSASRTRSLCSSTILLTALLVTPLHASDVLETLSDGEMFMAALAKELERSMTLQMEDLESPYFIQLNASETASANISATYGALHRTGDGISGRQRGLSAKIRIGDFELDNTNFQGGGYFGGGGGYTQLPVDDDEMAIRQAAWLALDGLYKSEVESLTKKRAYMKDKTIEDRPHDFSAAEPGRNMTPVKELVVDQGHWEGVVKQLSARVGSHIDVQDSSASMTATAANKFVLSSEGTRVCTGSTWATLSVNATTQAPDGTRFSDSLRYSAPSAEDLPDEQEVLADIDAMVEELLALRTAPKVESYLGPVLFADSSAPAVVRAFLEDGLAGQPEPVGSRRQGGGDSDNLEKKIDSRILPRSFQVFDDPTLTAWEGEALSGHYTFDDEGVPAQRVDLVVGGQLKAMVMSRAPTEKFTTTNGHGRLANPYTGVSASISNLVMTDDDALPPDELDAMLLEVAADEGLEYGIRVEALQSGRGSGMRFFFGGAGGVTLPDPLRAYKVYVEDGRRELIRGVQFGPVNMRSLRDILGAGEDLNVANSGTTTFGAATSVSAPALLFEELELVEIEQELDHPPFLPSPMAR